MAAQRPLALVTGGRRGIGAAIAVELAGRGMDIALADIAAEGADETLQAVQAQGARARFFHCDLAQTDAHPALVQQIAAWGGAIAVLVNNAGVASPVRGDLLDVQPQAFDSVMGVNLRGTFFMTQAVARHMLDAAQSSPTQAQPQRAIVTLSSVSAELASVERGAYCLSKSGLPMLTRLFALRLAAHAIGVFEVRPGIIRTAMTQGVAAHYDQRIAQGLVPMQRWGEPGDVARAVALLACGQLPFATGSVLTVDGALSIPRL